MELGNVELGDALLENAAPLAWISDWRSNIAGRMDLFVQYSWLSLEAAVAALWARASGHVSGQAGARQIGAVVWSLRGGWRSCYECLNVRTCAGLLCSGLLCTAWAWIWW